MFEYDAVSTSTENVESGASVTRRNGLFGVFLYASVLNSLWSSISAVDVGAGRASCAIGVEARPINPPAPAKPCAADALRFMAGWGAALAAAPRGFPSPRPSP